MPSLYALKPRFQALLRPGVVRLYRAGVTANQVTLFACTVSVLLGLLLYVCDVSTAWFALIPVWMLLRMACNAIDGMLAREHAQQTPLGAFLNELSDVVSDAALILPFARVAPFDPFWIALVVVLAALTEFAGALGPNVGASRRYDGPVGKSDRALLFGVLGLYIAWAGPLPDAAYWVMPALAMLLAWTTVNRVRKALIEIDRPAGQTQEGHQP